jgi:hypothetical protein
MEANTEHTHHNLVETPLRNESDMSAAEEDDKVDVPETGELKQNIMDEQGMEAAKDQGNDNGQNLLFEEELAVRKAVSNGFSGNLLSSFVVNGYASVLIFVFHLISLESLLSIALSVSMTICKFFLFEELSMSCPPYRLPF